MRVCVSAGLEQDVRQPPLIVFKVPYLFCARSFLWKQLDLSKWNVKLLKFRALKDYIDFLVVKFSFKQHNFALRKHFAYYCIKPFHEKEGNLLNTI